jgi:hypothetical protein
VIKILRNEFDDRGYASLTELAGDALVDAHDLLVFVADTKQERDALRRRHSLLRAERRPFSVSRLLGALQS